MLSDDVTRLRHMLDAARLAQSFIEGKTRESLSADFQLALALQKAIEIIGEAATQTSNDCRNKIPRIPWLDIIAMRNRLIHGYADINLDILWKTVIDDLPPLVSELQRVLEEKGL